MTGVYFAKVYPMPPSKQGDIVEEIEKYEEVARMLYITAREGRYDQLPILREQLEIAKEQALSAIQQSYENR